MSKKAYTSVKKGLYLCQKRPILVPKYAYNSVKIGPHTNTQYLLNHVSMLLTQGEGDLPSRSIL